MNRPEKIYLSEMITIEGIKIGRTLQGLEYLIEHYTHIMNTATPQQMDDNTRKHFKAMIIDMQLHVHLYGKQFVQTQDVASQPLKP